MKDNIVVFKKKLCALLHRELGAGLSALRHGRIRSIRLKLPRERGIFVGKDRHAVGHGDFVLMRAPDPVADVLVARVAHGVGGNPESQKMNHSENLAL